MFSVDVPARTNGVDLDLCVSDLYCGVMATNATRNFFVKLMDSWGFNSKLSSILSIVPNQLHKICSRSSLTAQ
jgi:hypothetical protein